MTETNVWMFIFQISTNSTISRGIVSGNILGMASSTDTARLKTVSANTHAHTKVVHHVLGKKTTGAGMTGTIKVGVPPPVPPNKPAMSAIYKPMAAAAAAAAALKAETSNVADLASKK